MTHDTLIELITRIKSRQLVNDDLGVINLVREYFETKYVIQNKQHDKFSPDEL